MNLAPSYAPTRCAIPRHAVGQAVSNPAGAGKWMPSPRHRGGACAPRPYVCRRASRSAPPAKFDCCANALVAVARHDRFFAGALSRVLVDTVNNAHGIARPLPTFFEVDPITVAVLIFARDVRGVESLWFLCGHNELGVDGFGEGHVVLFAQGLGRVLIGEATEDFGAFESTNNNPMGAVVVEYGHRTADGLGFGAVCSHYPHTIASRLECVNRYFKKRYDFFGRWESGTYGAFYREARDYVQLINRRLAGVTPSLFGQKEAA
jgi:hypothetical protein